MKRFIFCAVMAALLAPSLSARCLVITLKNGQRMAFQLDEGNVVMTHTDTQLNFNGMTIDREQIMEFRIFAQTPKDATTVGMKSVKGEEGNAKPEIYDLSGRRATNLRPGIYVINKKKVVIP